MGNQLKNAGLLGLAAVGAGGLLAHLGKKAAEYAERVEEETKQRRSMEVQWPDEIGESEFEEIVRQCAKKWPLKIKQIFVNRTDVFVKVRGKERGELNEFQLDFNDYGRLTGRYWKSGQCYSTDIPDQLAERISTQLEKKRRKDKKHSFLLK